MLCSIQIAETNLYNEKILKNMGIDNVKKINFLTEPLLREEAERYKEMFLPHLEMAAIKILISEKESINVEDISRIVDILSLRYASFKLLRREILRI